MNAIPKPLKGMPMKFDYSYLGSEQDHVRIKRMENEINILLGSKDKNAFRIGELLTEAKSIPPPNLFNPWIEAKLQVSAAMTYQYIRVTERFGDHSSSLEHLSVSTLYELASPGIPQDLRDSVLSGEYTPTTRELRALNSRRKEAKQHLMIHSEQAKSREATIQDLASQLAHMQQQITALPPQVQEVIKYVTPPEVLEEIETLRQEATKWHSEWKKIVEDRKSVVEEYERVVKDLDLHKRGRIRMTEQYNALAEEHEKIAHERDVLLGNWNAVSKNNKHMGGKLNSLASLIERFHNEYLQIQNANALIVYSTVATRQNGDN